MSEVKYLDNICPICLKEEFKTVLTYVRIEHTVTGHICDECVSKIRNVIGISI